MQLSIRKPTIYILSNEIQKAKDPPAWIILSMIALIVAAGSIYGLLGFMSREDAIFYICVFDYYIISAIIIAGYIRVFYGFFTIMLI
jgi:hypothetical protein